MNLKRFFVPLAVAVLLLASTSQVFASPTIDPNPVKPTAKAPHGNSNKPIKTPDPKNDEQHGKSDKPKGKPEESRGKFLNYQGMVSAIDTGNISLTLKDGSTITIALTENTQIQSPGHKDTAASIEAGMRVSVQATRDEDKGLLARRIAIIPGKPALSHAVGWVTEYTPGVSITIQAHDDNLYTFLLTADTKILPAERADELTLGSRVTIIAPRDPSSLESTAKGIVVHPSGSGEGSQPATLTPIPTATFTPTPTATTAP